jgi:putative hemolysin
MDPQNDGSTMSAHSKTIKTVLAGLALAAAPVTAYAVNVSSNDGSGSQGVTSWYNNGASLSGSLRSTHGNPVYFSGVVVYDWQTDFRVGRYTSNTSTTYSVTRGGILSYVNGADGVKVQICRDRNNYPDPCGSYSSTMHK